MQTQNIEKQYCTTREAANLLGVSVGSVQQWVERGLLQAWKTKGGHRRLLRESVQAMLQQRQTQFQAPVASPSTAPAAVEPQTEQSARGLRRLRVLAIDGDPGLLQRYKDAMAGWSLAPEVCTCDTAVAGMVMVGRYAPDLLLFGVQMLGADGFNLLRQLMNMPELQETSIVVMPAADATALPGRGKLPAGVEVLPSPESFDRLREIAMEVCAKKHLERRTT